MCCDADLKLSDLLRYYSRDSQACKDLLYRRSKVLAQYEKSNKDLDNARAKGKNVQQVSGIKLLKFYCLFSSLTQGDMLNSYEFLLKFSINYCYI